MSTLRRALSALLLSSALPVAAAGPASLVPPAPAVEELPDRPLEPVERRASGSWLRVAGGAEMLREAGRVSPGFDAGWLRDLDGRFTLGLEGRLAMGTGWTSMGAGPVLQLRGEAGRRLAPYLGAEVVLGMMSVDASKGGVTTRSLPAGLRTQAATSQGGPADAVGGGERSGNGGPAPFRFCAAPALAGGLLVRLAGDFSLDVALRWELRVYRGAAHDVATATFGVRTAI
jgi:hypothetical protein